MPARPRLLARHLLPVTPERFLLQGWELVLSAPPRLDGEAPLRGLTLRQEKGHRMKPLTPTTIARPFARYSHAMEVPGGSRLVLCSGQLGMDAHQVIPPDVEGQARLCFRNIGAILAEAGMDFSNLVRINAYVTGREHMAGYMKVRDEFTQDPPPASTLMIVSGFTREEFVVEVEVIAAG